MTIGFTGCMARLREQIKSTFKPAEPPATQTASGVSHPVARRHVGIVTSLRSDGSYGFIAVTNRNLFVFFHSTALRDAVGVGDRVSFYLGMDHRGRVRAEEVYRDV